MRPLDGIRVVEMAGLAPSPFCGMILADFGAEVLVVDRTSKRAPEIPNAMEKNPFDRGKRSMRVDLKTEEGKAIVRKLIASYDVLLEPYRPGVMEKLGLGPEEAMAWNPGLVYARLTGWGQSGAYARMAGHDINYIALSGALSLFRREGEKPLPPCNFLGDFAGGGLICALGILLALMEREKSGRGQIIDSAMLDGVVYLSTQFYGLLANGLMTSDIGTNMLDGGAPYYQVYETSDGKYVTLGAIEERFYGELLEILGMDTSDLPPRDDRAYWKELKGQLAKIFKRKTRDEWAAIFEGRDACVAPLLELKEVEFHPHNRDRGVLLILDDVLQPAPAPRLSRTPGFPKSPPGPRGTHTREALKDLGYSDEEVSSLLEKDIVE